MFGLSKETDSIHIQRPKNLRKIQEITVTENLLENILLTLNMVRYIFEWPCSRLGRYFSFCKTSFTIFRILDLSNRWILFSKNNLGMTRSIFEWTRMIVFSLFLLNGIGCFHRGLHYLFFPIIRSFVTWYVCNAVSFKLNHLFHFCSRQWHS